MAKKPRAEKAASIGAKSGIWSSMHNTPLEIWREILCYQSVKSLVRFRSVSKLWKSIIEESAFASLQRYNNNKDLVPPLIVNELVSKKWWVYCSKIFQKISEIKSPPIEVDHTIWSFRGARDGLVLFQSNHVLKNTLMLWNPSIQKSVYISPPPILSEEDSMVVFLGFDPSEDNYRVVTLIMNHITMRPSFHVFSLKSRSWAKVRFSVVGKSPGTVVHHRFWEYVSIEEYIHWIGVVREDKNRERNMLVSLNLTTMTILYTLIPDELDLCCPFLIGKSFSGHSFIGILTPDQIWVLNDLGLDPSWKKMFETKVNILNLRRRHYVYLTKDGLLLSWKFNKLYVLDFKTGEEKESRYSGNTTLPSFVNDYVESLVLLNWR